MRPADVVTDAVLHAFVAGSLVINLPAPSSEADLSLAIDFLSSFFNSSDSAKTVFFLFRPTISDVIRKCGHQKEASWSRSLIFYAGKCNSPFVPS
jgi:hypothetical protein